MPQNSECLWFLPGLKAGAGGASPGGKRPKSARTGESKGRKIPAGTRNRPVRRFAGADFHGISPETGNSGPGGGIPASRRLQRNLACYRPSRTFHRHPPAYAAGRRRLSAHRSATACAGMSETCCTTQAFMASACASARARSRAAAVMPRVRSVARRSRRRARNPACRPAA